MSFIATVTLQMAVTIGIFRPISIGFQGEHISSGIKFRGIGVGQFAAGFCKTFISRCYTNLWEGRKSGRQFHSFWYGAAV